MRWPRARLGNAPIAIVLADFDAILAVAAEVARMLYGLEIPIVVLESAPYGSIKNGTPLRVVGEESGSGWVEITGALQGGPYVTKR